MFVEAGGVLIGDGSTVEVLADYGVAQGVSVFKPAGLFTKGAIMRGVFTDKASPLAYGYDGKEMPVYFNADPVLTVGAGDRSLAYFDPNAPGAGISQNTTPNAVPQPLSSWADAPAAPASSPMDPAPPPAEAAANAAPTPAKPADPNDKYKGPAPRVVMQIPDKADDILLSGLLTGGGALTKKALVGDAPLGKGHMVLYALRPFWRWQTQGSYFLGFNALLNWDHLDAGTPAPGGPKGAGGR